MSQSNGSGSVLDYNARIGLEAIFNPKSVAVVGATERPNSVGRTILFNLISNPFGGVVYPVNPKRESILGVKAYASITDCPGQVDLVVIVTPAKTVPGLVQEAVDNGIKGAIIISAGFKERGEEGVELERQVMSIARGKMRIIGPNCLGVMNPVGGMNATFAAAMANPGNIGFLSQSGAMCTSVLDYSFEENIGFSAFVSVGSMLDVDWGDLIYFLGDDPHTDAIVIYMEAIGNARSFLSAAREVALKKPIIVVKAGRTEEAAQAAASHTGSLTGSDDVLDAAFRRVGVLRVDEISDIFYTAEVLSKQPRPKGNRLSIITNAGGPGVLATDALIRDGGELAPISDETMEKLNEILPAAWSHANPIDILGDATPETYAKSLEVAAQDDNADGLLVILTPQAMTDPTLTAEYLEPYADIGKPVIASWMGGEEVRGGEQVLAQASIPNFPFPDTAVRLFNYMWRYSYSLRGLYEVPDAAEDADGYDRETAQQIITEVRAQGRQILTETESKAVLAAYDIPTIPMAIAETAESAVVAADEMGYPVVVKLNSETITHKTDVGGVRLNLQNGQDVEEAFNAIQRNVVANEHYTLEDFNGVSVQPMIKLDDGYELILGSSLDAQFGPVLLFGTGGTLVEVFKDKALGLPPLTTTLARRMIEQTKIAEALKGIRGRDPVDTDLLEKIIVRFGQLAVENPWISEMDINPLFVSDKHILALDARVVLHPADTDLAMVPQPAIRPYPNQYVTQYEAEDGTLLTVRPIKPEDEPMAVHFHQTLSEQTVALRYMYNVPLEERITHERLAALTYVDYDRQIALVAVDGASEEPRMVAVARLKYLSGTKEVGEFSILVSDDYQGKGLGSHLLDRLLTIGKQEGVERVFGKLLIKNNKSVEFLHNFGFTTFPIEGEDGVLMGTKDL
jgi:acetyltransferase